MTAPNHALTGALIGLSIANPAVALPLAFLSHFAQDAVPHYDLDAPEIERIGSRRLVREQILLGGVLCALLVLLLVLSRPHHWWIGAIAAFLAASPDLFWIPRWLHVRRNGTDKQLNWFLRFHSRIQWCTAPAYIWIEAVWFIGCSALLWHYL